MNVFSHDDINLYSIDSDRKSNYMIGHHTKLNQTSNMELKKIHPINMEINKRILRDDKSESTFLHPENASQNIESEEICNICHQVFEAHGVDFNLELFLVQNKYEQMMECVSNDGKSVNLLSPKSASSFKSIHTMFHNQKMMTINYEKSRGRIFFNCI